MTALPSVILWEVTYACPLRCPFCYSESGLRPSRQLPLAEMLRLADRFVTMKPRVVHLSGGEPLIVRDLMPVIARLAEGGISVVMTTSGFGLSEEWGETMRRHCHSIHVSIDGPDAATHDLLRGRAGSFEAALRALTMLGGLGVRFGIDVVVVRSNFELLPRIMSEVVARFPRLEFVIFNGVVPQGLASRESYERELLTDEQTRRLADDDFAAWLEARAGTAARVFTRDNLDLRMDPLLVDEDSAWTLDRLIVEPDGQVRALELYEGLVGNLLDEPPEAVWERVVARRQHSVVTEALRSVKSSQDWAAAARAIDRSFASAEDLARFARRKPY
jgi:MoaA/NifB/PqqE/SkfB family radical SAM enzyme